MSLPFFLWLTTILAISLSPLPPTTANIAADRAALLALRSAVGGRALLWNLSEPDTCLWPGVQCSSDKKFVIELHLPGTGLSGKIPPATIANLTGLQTLSLRYNALSGPLPPDIFSSLRDLRNVFLQHNFFSGEIPGAVFSLPNLVRLNLAHNNFSGSLPPSINNLTRLATLYLQENRFSGSIPELHLPGLVQFNVSNNQLTGPIPGGLSGQPKSAFQGNSLCGPPLDLCGKSKKKTLSGGAIAGIAIGCVVGLLLILLILFLLCKKRGEKRNPRSATVATAKQTETEIPPQNSAQNADVDGGRLAAKQKGIAAAAGNGNGKHLVFFTKTGRSFDLDDLLKASAEVLGKGTFGTAYKAVLEMGLTMVVKRLRDVSVPEMEFRAKIEEVGKMNNEFLVPLRAYYYSRDEKLLVYDYISMGSLSALLHGNKGGGRTPLNWETRATIALNAARGISYLHSQGPSVSHGNVKSSNILLTESYEARVSDFGLAQLIGPSSTPNRVDGYRAPEVTDSRKVSQKADVYSFGVLLLELLTGKAPTHSLTNEEGVDLPRWVQSIVREEWTAEVFDLELQDDIPWCMMFADDIVLIDETKDGVERKLELWRHTLETRGFRVSRSKTEYLECKFSGNGSREAGTITFDGNTIRGSEFFRYLGSILQKDGELDGDVAHRIKAGWLKWKSATGLICDQGVPHRLKGKFYRTAIRPALLYGTECWAVKHSHVHKMSVAEMRMLRWMCGHTRKDRLRNEVIREKVQVAPIEDKLMENRLRWFGHVRRRPIDAPVRRLEKWGAHGLVRGRGRPKQTWIRVIENDMRFLGIGEVMALDKTMWRERIRVVD